MPLVVGVSFRKAGKVYHFSPEGLDIVKGDMVLAETARGIEFGEVVSSVREMSESELIAPLKPIVRIATDEDIAQAKANEEKEKEAFEICEQKIAEHNLPMKLTCAEYSFDRSQITFSFSADGRIDFRELVRDVASTLHTKVQLHQIGVRDEAKLIGGYGSCGRNLCCSTFLTNFDPISMKMAKDQSLFLNPAKFSGACGKLLCCLRYEHEFYKEAHEKMPNIGSFLIYNGTKVKVVDYNVISNIVTVQNQEDVLIQVPLEELKKSEQIEKKRSFYSKLFTQKNDDSSDSQVKWRNKE